MNEIETRGKYYKSNDRQFSNILRGAWISGKIIEYSSLLGGVYAVTQPEISFKKVVLCGVAYIIGSTLSTAHNRMLNQHIKDHISKLEEKLTENSL